MVINASNYQHVNAYPFNGSFTYLCTFCALISIFMQESPLIVTKEAMFVELFVWLAQQIYLENLLSNHSLNLMERVVVHFVKKLCQWEKVTQGHIPLYLDRSRYQ